MAAVTLFAAASASSASAVVQLPVVAVAFDAVDFEALAAKMSLILLRLQFWPLASGLGAAVVLEVLLLVLEYCLQFEGPGVSRLYMGAGDFGCGKKGASWEPSG